ncbi:hypothetical protein NPIL_344731 [Nephila pilipes]|uniref:Uncharacterized protein n=1 Tax=Nephila pilipes TaxID=299642 RepID=A0A8X6T4A0_NEPPI|nr:hypothetical protein NPIL_344731 [Nephila pilipes]
MQQTLAFRSGRRNEIDVPVRAMEHFLITTKQQCSSSYRESYSKHVHVNLNVRLPFHLHIDCPEKLTDLNGLGSFKSDCQFNLRSTFCQWPTIN